MVDLEFSDKTRWLSLREACRLLDVNEATLRQWADQGHLRVYRTPGGHRRFLREDVMSLSEPAYNTAAEEPERKENPEGSALRRIRRRLHQDSVARQPWYQSVEEEGRLRMRLFGRRLLSLLLQDVPRRQRQEALEESHLVGREYGAEMSDRGVGLKDTIEAFIFFRALVLDSTNSRSWSQILELADSVLLGVVESYQARLAVPQSKITAPKNTGG